MTIPVDRLDQLAADRFDLGINVHSWSECTRETVRYWLRLLQDLRVRYLFVVPHDEHFTTKETRGRTDTFLPDILEAGYRVVQKGHKYEKSPILRSAGVAPAWYWLFARA